MNYKEKGNEAIQQGKLQDAIELFTKAIEQDPKDHFSYSNRSAVFLTLEEIDKAFDDAQKCIDIQPDWSKGYIRKGNVLIEAEKLDEAEEQFRIALSKDPDNTQLKNLVDAPKRAIELKKQGNDLLSAGKIDDAVKVYTEALKLKVLQYLFYSNRSVAYHTQGKFVEALHDAEEAIRCRSKFGKSYLRKGNALVGLKRLKDAEKAYQDGLKVEPKNSSLEKQLKAVQKMILDENKLVHIHNPEEWKTMLKERTNLIVVDFYAVWCGPCKQVAPYFEQMAKDFPEVTFAKVDVDIVPQVAQTAGIRAMPTFQFIKNGKTLDTLEGADLGGIMKRIEKFSKK